LLENHARRPPARRKNSLLLLAGIQKSEGLKPNRFG
jgi:hypothetical protein